MFFQKINHKALMLIMLGIGLLNTVSIKSLKIEQELRRQQRGQELVTTAETINLIAATDPYEILGIARDASVGEVRKAFKKLALQWHPDKYTDPSQKEIAEENFKKVSQAYQTIFSSLTGTRAPEQAPPGQMLPITYYETITTEKPVQVEPEIMPKPEKREQHIMLIKNVSEYISKQKENYMCLELYFADARDNTEICLPGGLLGARLYVANSKPVGYRVWARNNPSSALRGTFDPMVTNYVVKMRVERDESLVGKQWWQREVLKWVRVVPMTEREKSLLPPELLQNAIRQADMRVKPFKVEPAVEVPPAVLEIIQSAIVTTPSRNVIQKVKQLGITDKSSQQEMTNKQIELQRNFDALIDRLLQQAMVRQPDLNDIRKLSQDIVDLNEFLKQYGLGVPRLEWKVEEQIEEKAPEISLKKGDVKYIAMNLVSPGQLRFTQPNVETKTKKLEKQKGQFDDGKSSLSDKDAIPVVLGPDGLIVLIDSHHERLAAKKVGDTTVPVKVKDDLSHLSREEFFNQALAKNYIYPFDKMGNQVALPATGWFTWEQMQDDPNRLFISLTLWVCAPDGKGFKNPNASEDPAYPMLVKKLAFKDVGNNPFGEFKLATVLYQNGLVFDYGWGTNPNDATIAEFTEKARGILKDAFQTGKIQKIFDFIPEKMLRTAINNGNICGYEYVITPAEKAPEVISVSVLEAHYPWLKAITEGKEFQELNTIYEKIYDEVTATDLKGNPKESPEMQLAVLEEILRRHNALPLSIEGRRREGRFYLRDIISDIQKKIKKLREKSGR